MSAPHSRYGLRPAALVLACAGLALCGCTVLGSDDTLRALPTADVLESQAVEAPQKYFIGSRDVLKITVWNHPDLSVESVSVRVDGKISFPLLDDVQAQGLTPTELKAILTERLVEYVTSPHVTVIVVTMNSKLIYVIGEVARQGALPFSHRIRVIDVLAQAGGFNQFAAKRRVKIIREYNGDVPLEFVFDYEEFVRGENIEQNILLMPGDRIVIPPERPFPW